MFQGMHTVKQGVVGIGVAIAEFTKKGWIVSIPLIDAQGYDIIIDYGEGLRKVQVKTTSYKPDGSYAVQLKHVHHNKAGNIVKKFVNTDVDFVFVLCDNGECFLIPTSEITQKTEVRLYGKYLNYKL